MSIKNELFEKATYSPEDNKLRIYPHDFDEYLEQELFNKLKEAGFKPAYKQKLFVAHHNIAREDICIELCGEITFEETTLVERAEQRAERFDDYAYKRAQESNAYAKAAECIASRMANQPVLINHHSQRQAEKANKQIERNEDKAEETLSKANYWLRRATGVERFANIKSDPSVRVGRIKGLKKDLRDVQKSLNHAYLAHKLWTKLSAEVDLELREKRIRLFSGEHLVTGATVPYALYSELYHQKISVDEFVEKAIAIASSVMHSTLNMRKINHVLNRLAYERHELGGVVRHKGIVTATMIKAFARENGAHKPECKRIDGVWELSSSVPLPLHINPECERWLVLEDDEWIELFYAVGYEVPAEKSKAPSILNFKANKVEVVLHNKRQWLNQVHMTKAEYSAIYKDSRGCKLTPDGLFKVKICSDPNHTGPYYSAPWVCVFLTDSKVHGVPSLSHVEVEENGVAA